MVFITVLCFNVFVLCLFFAFPFLCLWSFLYARASRALNVVHGPRGDLTAASAGALLRFPRVWWLVAPVRK